MTEHADAADESGPNKPEMAAESQDRFATLPDRVRFENMVEEQPADGRPGAATDPDREHATRWTMPLTGI